MARNLPKQRLDALARRLKKSKNFREVSIVGPFVTFKHNNLVYAFRVMNKPFSENLRVKFELYCVNTDDTIKILTYEDIDLRKVKQMIETYEKSKGGVRNA